MAASLPPPGPIRNLRFAYTPRVADLWRILKEVQDELNHNGDIGLLGEIHDLISTWEMRDKELEDALVPPYRSRVVTNDNSQLSIPNAIWTTIGFQQIQYDTTNSFSQGGTKPGPPFDTYTAPLNGYYSLQGHVRMSGFSANNLSARFQNQNATGFDFVDGVTAPGFANTFGAAHATTLLYLNQGDKIQFQVLQDSGVSELTDFAVSSRFWFSVHLHSHQVYS